jgi:hypothetical protein
MSEKQAPVQNQTVPTEPVAPTPQAAQSWDNAQYQQPQNVQYVVMQKALQGVGGWLAFFVVVFCLAAVGYMSYFFSALSSMVGGSGGAIDIVNLIMSIPVAAVAATAAVLISLQKKAGKSLSFAALGVMAVTQVLNNIIIIAESGVDSAVIGFGNIIVGLIIYTLVGVYFVASKRVKATLVK